MFGSERGKLSKLSGINFPGQELAFMFLLHVGFSLTYAFTGHDLFTAATVPKVFSLVISTTSVHVFTGIAVYL